MRLLLSLAFIVGAYFYGYFVLGVCLWAFSAFLVGVPRVASYRGGVALLFCVYAIIAWCVCAVGFAVSVLQFFT